MHPPAITQRDRRTARMCVKCPVCTRARRRQKGLPYRVVRSVERRIRPFCRACERVYGRKTHERLPSA